MHLKIKIFFYIFGSFVRLVSLLGIAISIFLPGIWIALITYHPDQIPLYVVSYIKLIKRRDSFSCSFRRANNDDLI
ncbi:spore germination protein [Bacillus pacificus]